MDLNTGEKSPLSPMARLRVLRRVRRHLAGETDSPGFKRFQGELNGQLPEPRGRSIVVAACDDPFYWRYATMLLLSMERLLFTEQVHLHLCRPDSVTLDHIADLSSRLSHVSLSWTWDDGALARRASSPDIYYRAARFLLAKPILDATRAPVLCIDADGLAMRPVSPTFDKVRGRSDVMLFRTEKRGILAPKVHAGALGIAPTREGRAFATALASALCDVLEAGPTSEVDELVLRHLADGAERQKLSQIADMPLSLMDSLLGPESTIWSPRGHGGKSAAAYESERRQIAISFPQVSRTRQAYAAALEGESDASAASTRSPAARENGAGLLQSPRLKRVVERHTRWIERLGIRNRPWLILGSAPDPTIPADLVSTHARVDINNAGRTAAAMGLGRADLTVRAKKKSWAEHPHVDTRGLIWLHPQPAWVLRLLLLNKPYDHIGSVIELSRPDRDAIVTHVAASSVQSIGDLGKVTNGVAAACYGLLLGVPQIVLAGISLTKEGHSYDDLGRRRRQVDEDAFILDRLKSNERLLTTEPDLAGDTGIRLWKP